MFLSMRLRARFLPLFWGVAIAALCCNLVQSAERPPNFVFFLVDDLGYMDVGCNNPKSFYDTPNIDRLAQSGMRFTSGYAACPVCSPTRYSIMSGKYPTRVGATNFFSGVRAERFEPAPLNDRMPLEEVTLAETLKKHGYATFFAGKWHLGPGEKFWPEAQGFDINIGGHRAGGPGGNGYFSPYRNPKLADGPDGEYLDDRLASDTTKFIEEHKDKPFLAYLAFYSVHIPLMGKPDFVKKYQAKAKAAQTKQSLAKFAQEEQNMLTDEVRKVRIVQDHAVYAAMVESMDVAVGTVLNKLDELGLAENTVVIFTSDNGGLSTAEGSPTSNLPLRGGKGWLYEGGIRVPVVIRAPGVTKPNTTCDTPIVSTDYYPTILDLAGRPAEPKQHLDGVSVKPLLAGETKLARDAIFWHYPHYSNQGGMPGAAMRSGDWKLIERFEDGRTQLYNLAEDISENNDLAEKEPERVAAMRKALHAWYKEVDAKFLRAKNNGPEPWKP